MTITTKNAVSTPAKFEVGKRYRVSPNDGRTITVIKRNPTTIDFCLDGNESKTIRRKFFDNTAYAHDSEIVVYGSTKHRDYFWVVAKDVIDDAEIENADTGKMVAEPAVNTVNAERIQRSYEEISGYVDEYVAEGMTPEEAEQAVTQELLDGMIQANARGCCVDKISRWYANTFGDKADAVDEDAIENYYAISTEAFDIAVAWEIEFAEQAAFEAKMVVREARMLADDELAARYEKAKSQVKRDGYSWYFKGKNRAEWECDETKAAACLTRYGLSRYEFGIFHDAEVAAIENAGYDETAFDLLPNFEDDELRDYLYDFDERQQLLEDKYEPKPAAVTVSEKPELDASEYAISQAAFDVAVDAERDNAFKAKTALERYKICRGVLGHTIDSRGRYMWHDISGRIIDKQRVAELLSLHGLTVDEYLACEKIADAEYLAQLDAALEAYDAKKLIAEYAVIVEAQDIATNAEIEQATKSESTITKFERPALPVLQKHLSEAKAKLASLKRARDTVKKSYSENFSRENYNIAESRAFADELDERNAEINRQEEFVDWLEDQVAKSAAELAEEYAVTVEAQDIATDAEIEQVAANHIAEQYKAARKLADKPIDAGKTYTLTVHASEDFKELYGGDTLVKNYATCQHLYNGGKCVIFTNSWEIVRGGKTIATGDGINAFCRFITREFDVSERLAEIADAKSVDLEICGEHVCFQNGKFVWVMSPKYHAGFHAEAGIDGNEHYEISTADKNGKFTRGNFVTEEEFFIVMIERGGCTIDSVKIVTSAIETIDDPDKAYTLTVHVTNEDFRGYHVGDTIVKRFGTYAHMWDNTWLPRGGDWKLAHGSKTIATGNGYEDFHRFITCEYDVRERFAGMSDSNCFELEICGEYLSCQDFCRGGSRKRARVWSPKYKAGFFSGACIDDNKRYQIYTGAGMSIRRKFLTEEEFFNLMEKRGGCTIDTNQPPVTAEVAEANKEKINAMVRELAHRLRPDYGQAAEIEAANDGEPPVTDEDREEMNAAVRKFAQSIKDNYEQCRRAEQVKAQATVVPLTGNITVDKKKKAAIIILAQAKVLRRLF